MNRFLSIGRIAATGLGRVQALASSARATISNPKLNDLLKLGRLNHVAIATPDLQGATAMYRSVHLMTNYSDVTWDHIESSTNCK